VESQCQPMLPLSVLTTAHSVDRERPFRPIVIT
jgi:hypothetical protein